MQEDVKNVNPLLGTWPTAGGTLKYPVWLFEVVHWYTRSGTFGRGKVTAAVKSVLFPSVRTTPAECHTVSS